jgi:hypothetical protein
MVRHRQVDAGAALGLIASHDAQAGTVCNGQAFRRSPPPAEWAAAATVIVAAKSATEPRYGVARSVRREPDLPAKLAARQTRGCSKAAKTHIPRRFG